jgi:hypothetical protein
MNRRDFLKLASVSPLAFIPTKADAFWWLVLDALSIAADFLIANAERTALFGALSLAADGALAYSSIRRVSAASRLMKGVSAIGSVERIGFIAAERAIKASRRLSQSEKAEYLKALKVGERTIDVMEFVTKLEQVNEELANRFVDYVNSGEQISAVWQSEQANDIVVSFNNQANKDVITKLEITVKDHETGEFEKTQSFLLKAKAHGIGIYTHIERLTIPKIMI